MEREDISARLKAFEERCMGCARSPRVSVRAVDGMIVVHCGSLSAIMRDTSSRCPLYERSED